MITDEKWMDINNFKNTCDNMYQIQVKLDLKNLNK